MNLDCPTIFIDKIMYESQISTSHIFKRSNKTENLLLTMSLHTEIIQGKDYYVGCTVVTGIGMVKRQEQGTFFSLNIQDKKLKPASSPLPCLYFAT